MFLTCQTSYVCSGSSRDKSLRKVLTIIQNQRREPDLSDFIKFVDNEILR